MSDFGKIPLQLINLSILFTNNGLNLSNSLNQYIILIMSTLQLPQQLFNLLRLFLNRIQVFTLLLFITVWILILKIVLTDYLFVLADFVLQVL